MQRRCATRSASTSTAPRGKRCTSTYECRYARERGDTVYLTTADRWGNMASFIYSIYDYFGSQMTVPGTASP